MYLKYKVYVNVCDLDWINCDMVIERFWWFDNIIYNVNKEEKKCKGYVIFIFF